MQKIKSLYLVDSKPLFYSIFGGLHFPVTDDSMTGKEIITYIENTNGIKFSDIFRTEVNKLYEKYPEYLGDMVFIMDARKEGIYWRNKILKEYKLNRPISTPLNRVISAFTAMLTEKKPNFFLQLNGCEADDIIATIALNYANKYKDIIIISKDKDFNQLVGGNVFCTSCENPITNEEHISMILSGDRADGIPNVLSEDSSIVDKDKRQRTLGRKLKETYISAIVNGNELGGDVLKNYVRNKRLMDLRCIPESIVNKILIKVGEHINENDARGVIAST